MFKGGEDDWDSEELTELRNAVQEVPSNVEKQERWRLIADIVGTRSKRECYEKYKQLKDQKLARTQSRDIAESEAKVIREPTNLHELRAKQDSSRLAALSSKSRGSEDSDDDVAGLLEAVGLSGDSAEAKDSSDATAQAKGVEAKPSASIATNSDLNRKASQGVRLGRGVLRGPDATKSSVHMPAASPSSHGGSDDTLECRETSKLENRELSTSTAHEPRKAARVLKREPIKVEEAVEIKMLLFNDPRRVFPDAWKKQGFYFTKKARLGYGLVQRAGGPCGVIAAMNAYVLADLLHSSSKAAIREGDTSSWQEPSPGSQEESLLAAMSSVLYAASGGSGRCVVCLPTTQVLYRSSAYAPDGITERVTLVTLENFDSPNGLEAFFRDKLPAFVAPQGNGCLLLLLSAMLTRGLAELREDMDEGFAGEARTLLDRHHYMSQEGVNLLLCGRAVSNVFDGIRELGDTVQGSEDKVQLRGVPSRCNLGFLSLMEAYKYLEVGSYYKEPRIPVWVVFSESHYSVVFGLCRELAQPWRGPSPGAAPFDVYYWDPLAGQDEVIRLTLLPEPTEALPDPNDTRALIPPLDLVLRTKWAGCEVDWNDTEPAL